MMRPYSPTVTISYAQSLDGRIATRTGESRWISGNESLTLAHKLRDENDAIVVGIGTVRTDDPQLTCRLPGDHKNPVRIIFDSRLDISTEANVIRTAKKVKTILFALPDADLQRKNVLAEYGVGVESIDPDENGRIDIHKACKRIDELGYMTILVEGGSGIITSFLRSGTVNRMIIVTAPIFIGNGIQAVGDLGVSSLTDAVRPVSSRSYLLGSDSVWELGLQAAGS